MSPPLKAGCIGDFPFFIVPSMYDKKKMFGPYTITFYCDYAVYIQELDAEDRKV
mgnify:CR=1 FL=1